MKAKSLALFTVIALFVCAIIAFTFAYNESAYAYEEDLTLTPAPLYENGKDYIECAVGMLIKNIELPSGWSFKDDIDVNKPLIGVKDDFITLDVVYSTNGDTAEEPVSDALKIKLILPEAKFVNSVESSQQPSIIPVSVEIDDDNNVTAKVEQLVNPFTRTGYSLKGWELSDGTFIPYGTEEGEYEVGAIYYTIPSIDLIRNIIEINVVWAPNTDTKVTLNVYKQTTDGEYTAKIASKETTREGISDALYVIDENTVSIPEGFLYDYAECNGERGSEFTISPDGSTEINVYLKRKTYVLRFSAGEYSDSLPGGTLPEPITVRYGQAVELPKTTDFKVYGYHNLGWTDGVNSWSDGNLTVYSNKYAVSVDSAEEYVLSIVLEGDYNTEYVIKEYFDDEPQITTRTAKTGSQVTAGGGRMGYTRETRDGEKISGIVTGYQKDSDGNVIAGEMLELVVYYKSSNYTLKFANSEIEMRTDVKYGEEVTLEAPPARENYEFRYWLINGIKYEAGSSFTMPATNLSIQAVWKSTEEQITPSGTLIVPEEEQGLSGWAIAGIVIGSVVCLAGIAVGTYFIVKSKSRKIGKDE